MKTINSSEYEGYIWRSDSDSPQLVNGSFELTLEESENPFVIEGFLYSPKEKKSLTIKNFDGKYFIKEYNLVNMEGIDKEDILWMANSGFRRKGLYLHFIQFWRAKIDKMNLDMEVLEPAELVFVGFVNK